MSGVVQFMRSLVMAALLMGAAGTLVEATGIVGREAAKAHQHGGIKFKWLNQQLVGEGARETARQYFFRQENLITAKAWLF